MIQAFKLALWDAYFTAFGYYRDSLYFNRFSGLI